MKWPWKAGTSKGYGAGCTTETFQESGDDADELGQQPRQHPRDLHSHAIVNATPAGTQSSIVNAFTHPQASILNQPAQKPGFHFVETTVSQNIDPTGNNDGFNIDMDSFFQENNFMDPELSIAWDEEYGLKAKRAHTASVSSSTPHFDLSVMVF
jgi:hypothetical protein